MYVFDKKQDKIFDFLILIFILYLLASLTRLFNLNILQDSIIEQEFNGVNHYSVAFGNILFFISVIYICFNRKNLLSIIKLVFPLLLILLWSLISTLWSFDPYITVKRLIKLSVYVLFIVSLFLSVNPVEKIKSLFYIFSWVCGGLSLVVIIFFPQYGWMNYENSYLPCGIFIHKNGLAIFAALMLILLCLIIKIKGESLKKLPYHYYGLFIVLLVELIMSRAMDVLLGLLISFPVFLFLNFFNNQKRQSIVPFLLCILISTFFICYVFLVNFFDLNKLFEVVLASFGKDSTFTGRVDIWPLLLSIGIKNNPILGSGFGVFFLFLENTGIVRTLSWVMSHAHNTYLQVYLELGVVGLFLFLYLIIFTLVKIIKIWQNYIVSAPLFMVFFVLFIVQTFFENVLLSPGVMFLVMPVFLCLLDPSFHKYSNIYVSK